MALVPGAFRARAEDARDGSGLAPAVRGASAPLDAPRGREAARRCARVDDAGVARAWSRRSPPPRARPRRFSMDVTRREVTGETCARLGGVGVVRASAVCQEGCYPRKDHHVNQDASAVATREELTARIASIDDAGDDCVIDVCVGEMLIGVFDGHGKHGEDCASIACGTFAEFLTREARPGRGVDDEAYARVFERVNAVVCKSLGDDASFSGSTAITALFEENGRIRVGNVGDSRCVVGVELAPGQTPRNRHCQRWEVKDLTRDQTCFRADERKRMRAEAQNALSFATIGMVLGETPTHEDFGDGEPGSEDEYCDDPPRVFMAGQRFPGCAFTRSIGDSVGKTLGVSATPEITTYDLNAAPTTRCVIVASDGVFEFMSSAQTMAIAEKFYSENSPGAAELAAHAIVRAAYTRWQENDERADDITAVVAFIYPNDPHDSDTSTATVVVNDVEDTLHKLLL